MRGDGVATAILHVVDLFRREGNVREAASSDDLRQGSKETSIIRTSCVPAEVWGGLLSLLRRREGDSMTTERATSTKSSVEEEKIQVYAVCRRKRLPQGNSTVP